MKNTLKAIEYYLNNNAPEYFNQIKTIKEYAGQLSEALKNNSIVKLTDKLPAIYIMFVDGLPASEEPKFQFDLLTMTETKIFNRTTNNESNLDLANGIIKLFADNPGWQYNNMPYLVDREQLKCTTLMSDNRFDVKVINLFISNLS